MFHWICPECGREIAPTVRECAACDALPELQQAAKPTQRSSAGSKPATLSAEDASSQLKISATPISRISTAALTSTEPMRPQFRDVDDDAAVPISSSPFEPLFSMSDEPDDIAGSKVQAAVEIQTAVVPAPVIQAIAQESAAPVASPRPNSQPKPQPKPQTVVRSTSSDLPTIEMPIVAWTPIAKPAPIAEPSAAAPASIAVPMPVSAQPGALRTPQLRALTEIGSNPRPASVAASPVVLPVALSDETGQKPNPEPSLVTELSELPMDRKATPYRLMVLSQPPESLEQATNSDSSTVSLGQPRIEALTLAEPPLVTSKADLPFELNVAPHTASSEFTRRLAKPVALSFSVSASQSIFIPAISPAIPAERSDGDFDADSNTDAETLVAAEGQQVEHDAIETASSESTGAESTGVGDAENSHEDAIPALAGPTKYSPLATSGHAQLAAVPAKLIFALQCEPCLTLPSPVLSARLASFGDRELQPIFPGRLAPKRAMSPWIVGLLVAGTLLGAGVSNIFSVAPAAHAEAKSPTSQGDVPSAPQADVTTPVEATATPVNFHPSEAPSSVSASDSLSRSIEVSGFRIDLGSAKKPEIQYIVVNHSTGRLTGLMVYVTLRAANAKEGQPPLCQFSFQTPDLAAHQAKEMSSTVEVIRRPVVLPDWQDLRADIEIGH